MRGGRIERLAIRDLPAHALLLGRRLAPALQRAAEQVAQAEAIVVATPVYKAAYSGVLKVFLDLLPQSALKGKTVLPLATGGSPHHMLALDYALRPVLQSLAARHILPGVYATDAQVTLTPEGAYQLQRRAGAAAGRRGARRWRAKGCKLPALHAASSRCRSRACDVASEAGRPALHFLSPSFFRRAATRRGKTHAWTTHSQPKGFRP